MHLGPLTKKNPDKQHDGEGKTRVLATAFMALLLSPHRRGGGGGGGYGWGKRKGFLQAQR